MRTQSFVEIYPRAWSYQTALRDVLPDGRTIGNDTEYSKTTRKCQQALSIELADVVVIGVPTGTSDLVQWYRNLSQPAREDRTIKGKPVVDLDAPRCITQRVTTIHDSNGNPRRLQIVSDMSGERIAVIGYAYADAPSHNNAIEIGSITVAPAEYHSIVKRAKAEKKYIDGN